MKIAASNRIRLLDARLELTRHLTPDEISELAAISLPVVTVNIGSLELEALLAGQNAFGATVVDGLVMGSMHMKEQVGIHLLGPGDLLVSGSDVWPAWLADLEFRAATATKVALFGNDLLAAAYRWPRIVQGLYEAVGDQLRRLTAQLVICQLPRVEDRIMAMLWLLAESWGHVTPSGVRVPLSLTHETLGALVGSRRPTVSLALRRLTDEGALVPQDSGWLLLDDAPEPAEGAAPIAPQLTDFSAGRWAAMATPTAEPDPNLAYAELRETIRRLRDQHRVDAEHTRDQLRRIQSVRARSQAVRDRIAQDALRRSRPPSS